jgi:adenine-specific DNA-methyltransferase
MANEIKDLLDKVGDERLRVRLDRAISELKKTIAFGLVFEQHIPELLPIYSAPIRGQSRVSMRGGRLMDTYLVKRVHKDRAVIQREFENTVDETVKTSELVVVKRFGEPIFPALLHVDTVAQGGDAPHHLLIEADNYHALQLLEWLYTRKIDCIYIDPPYNTGAKDWKYNNNFVDLNDDWRHSKWLAFMEKRLRLAEKLLKPQSGVLVVTIDEHEVHHLGMLLERIFPEAYRQMVTIVITARGVAKQGLARVEEHAHFTFMGKASACATDDDFLTPGDTGNTLNPWASLLRRGTNAAPSDRPGLVYPILIDPQSGRIEGVGTTLAQRVDRGELRKSDLDQYQPPQKISEAWPIRSDGKLGTWQLKPSSLMQLKARGFVKLGRYDNKRHTWSVNYLKRAQLKEIEKRDLKIVGYEWEGGPAILEYSDIFLKGRRAKTVWYRTTHDAGT